MEQTPIGDGYNPDLLRLMPVEARRVVEVGCSSGSMAREFRKLNPACTYVGIDIDPVRAEMAKRHCDEVITLDIDMADDAFFAQRSEQDCWVFGDTLEHLKDPWRVLAALRPGLAAGGCVVACIPNAQHWSVLTRLAIGDFRYETAGLLDRTHLRWFTRQTILELFESTGFKVIAGMPRIFDDPRSQKYLPHIGAIAREVGVDPELAMNDALALQYVVRAVPV